MKRSLTIIITLVLCLTLVCIGAIAADRAEKGAVEEKGVQQKMFGVLIKPAASSTLSLGEVKEIDVATIPHYDDMSGVPGQAGGDIDDYRYIIRCPEGISVLDGGEYVKMSSPKKLTSSIRATFKGMLASYSYIQLVVVNGYDEIASTADLLIYVEPAAEEMTNLIIAKVKDENGKYVELGANGVYFKKNTVGQIRITYKFPPMYGVTVDAYVDRNGIRASMGEAFINDDGTATSILYLWPSDAEVSFGSNGSIVIDEPGDSSPTARIKVNYYSKGLWNAAAMGEASLGEIRRQLAKGKGAASKEVVSRDGRYVIKSIDTIVTFNATGKSESIVSIAATQGEAVISKFERASFGELFKLTDSSKKKSSDYRNVKFDIPTSGGESVFEIDAKNMTITGLVESAKTNGEYTPWKLKASLPNGKYAVCNVVVSVDTLTVDNSIETVSDNKLVRFIPTQTGQYRFTVETYHYRDVTAILYDENMTELAKANNIRNCKLFYTLSGGKTYYLLSGGDEYDHYYEISVESIADNTSLTAIKSTDGEAKAYIEKYTGSDASVVIPTYMFVGGEYLPVGGICHGAFSKSAIESVYIPGCVQFIGANAFSYCDKLNSVTLNNGLETIDNYAFYGCGALESITLPSSTKRIRDQAFACTGLKTAYLNEGLQYIYYKAFESSELRSISIPSSLEYIGIHTFESCVDLEEVRIAHGIYDIDGYAFSGCSKLSKVYIPQSIDWIDRVAFKNCDKVTIYGYTGSIAEAYAHQHGIPFVSQGKMNLVIECSDYVLTGSSFVPIVKYNGDIINNRVYVSSDKDSLYYNSETGMVYVDKASIGEAVIETTYTPSDGIRITATKMLRVVKPGDLTFSGIKNDAKNAQILLNGLADITKMNAGQQLAADVNGDGMITTKDLWLIMTGAVK